MLANKVVITGAAGLVGQNLILMLKDAGYTDIVAIDKHPANTRMLAQRHPDIAIVEANLAIPGRWEKSLEGAKYLVLCHAQIGGLDHSEFLANNVIATENILSAAKASSIQSVIHISSSVVNSMAQDFYTDSKKQQEHLVTQSGLPFCVLRPTLMFGWFDRKHLGWLSRFMKKTPVFPVPGHGRYLRQPLYVRDFCRIVLACFDPYYCGQQYDITGQEKIDYIDLIQAVKRASHARTKILRIPYGLFWILLKLFAVINRNPPFTVQQLRALVTPDLFEVIDWPTIFDVQSTTLQQALDETFGDTRYSQTVLEF